VTVAREQTDALSLALNDQAVAVVFDFVNPFRAVGDLGGFGRKAGLELGDGHVAKIIGTRLAATPASRPPKNASPKVWAPGLAFGR
jgi:hypothetical protein